MQVSTSAPLCPWKISSQGRRNPPTCGRAACGATVCLVALFGGLGNTENLSTLASGLCIFRGSEYKCPAQRGPTHAAKNVLHVRI